MRAWVGRRSRVEGVMAESYVLIWLQTEVGRPDFKGLRPIVILETMLWYIIWVLRVLWWRVSWRWGWVMVGGSKCWFEFTLVMVGEVRSLGISWDLWADGLMAINIWFDSAVPLGGLMAGQLTIGSDGFGLWLGCSSWTRCVFDFLSYCQHILRIDICNGVCPYFELPSVINRLPNVLICGVLAWFGGKMTASNNYVL